MEQLRTHLDKYMDKIYARLEKMSNKVQEMLECTCAILEKPDIERADAVIADDKEVDIYEMAIDDNCLQLIATEQPVASDLRRIISITKVTSDLERIGDIARYIAIKSKKEIPESFRGHIPQIIEMYQTGISMLTHAAAAFIAKDHKQSRAVAAQDDLIDEQHQSIQRAIIHGMKSDPEYIKNGQRLFEITRLIELLGDRATSICEWTIFAVEGKHIDLN